MKAASVSSAPDRHCEGIFRIDVVVVVVVFVVFAFSKVQSQISYRLITSCLAFMRRTRERSLHTLQIPCPISTREEPTASGMEQTEHV